MARMSVNRVFPGPFLTNVRNESLHHMARVVKRGTPTDWRWRLCEFQHRKSLFLLGTNNMLWRVLL